jgi:hypothetical protein
VDRVIKLINPVLHGWVSGLPRGTCLRSSGRRMGSKLLLVHVILYRRVAAAVERLASLVAGRHILLIVLRARPKTRADSRWLCPSMKTNRRTAA